MSLLLTSICLLYINGIWDFVSSISILLTLATERTRYIADAHLGLWIRPEDRDNQAAVILMSALLMQWCWTRICAGMDPVNRWQDAAYTYWLEASLVGVTAAYGRMHVWPSVAVVFLCIGCALIVMNPLY